ncbi:MAG: hypothetical protein O3B84_03125 [Chloroflexi bacterium]|nr:hypothetical protein [Chloroflexota bacterium]
MDSASSLNSTVIGIAALGFLSVLIAVFLTDWRAGRRYRGVLKEMRGAAMANERARELDRIEGHIDSLGDAYGTLKAMVATGQHPDQATVQRTLAAAFASSMRATSSLRALGLHDTMGPNLEQLIQLIGEQGALLYGGAEFSIPKDATIVRVAGALRAELIRARTGMRV